MCVALCSTRNCWLYQVRLCSTVTWTEIRPLRPNEPEMKQMTSKKRLLFKQNTQKSSHKSSQRWVKFHFLNRTGLCSILGFLRLRTTGSNMSIDGWRHGLSNLLGLLGLSNLLGFHLLFFFLRLFELNLLKIDAVFQASSIYLFWCLFSTCYMPCSSPSDPCQTFWPTVAGAVSICVAWILSETGLLLCNANFLFPGGQLARILVKNVARSTWWSDLTRTVTIKQLATGRRLHGTHPQPCRLWSLWHTSPVKSWEQLQVAGGSPNALASLKPTS